MGRIDSTPLILTFACALTVACASVRQVDVPRSHTETALQRDSLIRGDSLFIHDSIVIDHSGDTLLQKEYHVVYRSVYRDRSHTDTLLLRDTVTVVRKVTKYPGRWERIQMHLGRTFVVMLVSAVVLLLIYGIYRFLCGRPP